MISTNNLKNILTSILSKSKQEHDKDINHLSNNMNKGWISSGTIEDIHVDKVNEESPVGTIISVMGNSAPVNYLICDGTEYNISDYPELAEYFKEQFGSYNKFGGDGTTTFKVPDLRGEFLRGTGTNSHTNQGNGSDVGIHQDGTNQVAAVGGSGNQLTYYGGQNQREASDVDSITATTRYYHIGTTSTYNINRDTISGFIARPTNTSVLYCIKYRSTHNLSINMYDGTHYFTNQETIIGQWSNGKIIYRTVRENATKEFSATLAKTSTKNLAIYTYTFEADGTYQATDLIGYSEASSNEAFYKFYINDEYICKKYIYTGTTWNSNALYGGDVDIPSFTVKAGDILTIKIDWDGSHSNNVFGIKGVLANYPANVEKWIRKDDEIGIYEYTKTTDEPFDVNDEDISWFATDSEVDEIINKLGE